MVGVLGSAEKVSWNITLFIAKSKHFYLVFLLHLFNGALQRLDFKTGFLPLNFFLVNVSFYLGSQVLYFLLVRSWLFLELVRKLKSKLPNCQLMID